MQAARFVGVHFHADFEVNAAVKSGKLFMVILH